MLRLLAILLFATVVSCAAPKIQAPEKLLAKHLMEKYEDLGIEGRPVTNVNEAVKVEIGFNLNKILKVKNGYATVAGLLEIEWVDPFLDWEPKKFGGAKSIALPSDAIWTPDVTIYNDYFQNADEQEDSMEDADVLVTEDGKVLWVPRMTYKVPCHDDPKVAGQMTCTIQGGSWVYDTTKVDIDLEEDDIDLDTFERSHGIELVGHSAKVEDKEFECCPGLKYSIFKFNMVIKKKAHCDSKTGKC